MFSTSNDSARTRSPEPTNLAAITGTATTATGARVPGLRFADRRSHALLSALLVFRQHPNGFTNKDLRALTTELRGLDPDSVSAGQITYDLRRLRTHALIARVPHSHRYTVTDEGLDTAKFLTCVHDRVLRSGLARTRHPHTHPGPAPIRGHRLPPSNRHPHRRSTTRGMNGAEPIG